MLPEDVKNDKNITSYVLYDEDDKPICAYRRIDNTDEWLNVTSEVLKKYNEKIAAEKIEKENKKQEAVNKRIHTKAMNDMLQNMSKEEQIEFLKNELAKLNH